MSETNIDLAQRKEIADKQDDLRSQDFGMNPADYARPTGNASRAKVQRPEWVRKRR